VSHVLQNTLLKKSVHWVNGNIATVLVLLPTPLIKMVCTFPFKQFIVIARGQGCPAFQSTGNLKLHVVCKLLDKGIASMKCTTLYADIDNNLYTFKESMQKHLCQVLSNIFTVHEIK